MAPASKEPAAPANPNGPPLSKVMPTKAEARASGLEGAGPVQKVDLDSPENVNRWLRELDVTRDQLEAAVKAVGTSATEVEMYLKGSRSSTNADQLTGKPGP